MSGVSSWCTTALLAVGVVLGGCGGAKASKICTPNEATCVNDSTATVCSSDGRVLVPVQCGAGQTCTNGTCAIDPTAPCTAAENTCTDSTHAIVCSATGATSVTCPANTTCTGAGLCQGACVVGSAICTDLGTVSTCADGHTYTATACAAGMNCVVTGTVPYETAACKPSACTPDPNGCGAVCGDRSTGGTGNATNTVSTCVSTPAGYEWLTTQCASTESCSSNGATCASSAQAGCTAACTPGATRCDGLLGVQTCGTDHTWTTTACNTSATSTTSVCFVNTLGTAVCGDAVCVATGGTSATEVASGGGACDASGNFYLCGPDGKLATTATACPSGTACTPASAGQVPFGGTFVAGACQSECTTGEGQCLGTVSYRACIDGVWGPPTQCTTGTCQTYASASGVNATVCGVCAPGTARCTTDGTGTDTCDSTGAWQADVTCAAGSCVARGGSASCVTTCTPGRTVCVGAMAEVGSTGFDAPTMTATCTASGGIPDPTTWTACPTGQQCRKNASGTVLGCLACVGTLNEFGLPDTECVPSGDTAGDDAIATCKSDNSGFDITNVQLCEKASSLSCEPASTNVPFPASSDGSCVVLETLADGTVLTVSNTGLEAIGYGTCAHNITGQSLGTAEPCGTTPDCCANYCLKPAEPTPAACKD